MTNPIKLVKKYERNGWPSMPRPDAKPPTGWSLELISSLKRIFNHRLSPNGKQIAFFWESDDLTDLYLIPSTGGWPQRLSTDRGPTLFWNDEVPQWSPDGTKLTFTSGGHAWVLDAAGGSLPEKIAPYLSACWGARWMPDGQSLLLGFEKNEADLLGLVSLDGRAFKILTPLAEGDHWDPQPSPDGTQVAYTLRRFDDFNRLDICVLDLASGETKTVYGKPKTRAWGVRWSPDGKWLAFCSQENGHDDAWLVHPNGTGLKRLSEAGHDVSDLAWSPDGKQIACVLNRAGSGELALLNARTGALEVLRDTPGWHSRPQWSPGGAFLTVEFESPVQLPELYKVQVATGQVEALTANTPPVLAARRMPMPQAVSYKSFDGLEIPAFLFTPEKPNRAAIVWVHGGPSSQYTLGWDELLQYMLAKGYTVIAPNYRGSTGYGVAFEQMNYEKWGIEDTQDCLHAAEYLKTLPGIDPARIAIMGGSYGGYMTICSLARDPGYRFACGVAKYGDADVINSWALCSRELRYYTQIFLGHPAKNRVVYEAASPIQEAANVRKPMLILHGLKDDIVPPESSEQWVEALKRHDRTYEYQTYPTEPHGFVRRAEKLDAWRRIEQFLDWYLLPEISL